MAPYTKNNRFITMRRFSQRIQEQLQGEAPPYPQSYKSELFSPCLALQAQSPNFVFYDRAQGAVVEYPYPMSGGYFINLAGISKYKECRRQAFECWCGLLSPDTPMFVELRKTAHGSYASCDECGLNFSLDEKFQTTSMTADYPAFDKHAPTMPVSSPMAGLSAGGPPPQPIRLVSAGQGQGRGRGRGRGHKPVSWLGLGPRTPKKIRTRAAARLASSSPPSASKLLRAIKHKEPDSASRCPCTRNPVRFLSLTSLTSSAADGLVHGPNTSGMASGSKSAIKIEEEEETTLKFCDKCFAAYPVEGFAKHSCRS
ncbi:hypothetical protein K439DRAFT_1624692 [Ramaria rubella]|nr:hypothetical protein K439DRAFT_1624692 [Ramaria rubella]